MRYILRSYFAERIENFIDFKHNLGYQYSDSERVMWNFDTFCSEKFPLETFMTKEIGLAWSERKSSENQAGLRNRVMVIREFAKYLQGIGESAYVIPISLVRKPQKTVPHIFSDDEMRKFFRAADSFEYHDKAPARHLVIPVFFRLLYYCGLRPNEARMLLKSNVDVNTGIIKIEESKGHKDRLIVLSDDMKQLCKKYLLLIEQIFPLCPYFFPNYDGSGYYSKVWSEEMFWRCWDMAGIKEFSGSKPRVYDFRHTFATNCIYRWVNEGKNADAMIPYLSAYMGHVQTEDTRYYIHLVPQVLSMDLSKYNHIIPEVPYESFQ